MTLAEVDALLLIARPMGAAATIQVLCARAALLCLRRPLEDRSQAVAAKGHEAASE